jgi:cytochrome c biogenesis protein CcdA
MRKEPSAHGSALLMGAGIAGVELLTAFPYFAVIAMVLGSSVKAPAKVFLLVLYNLIYVIPLIAIVVVRAVMGERGAELLVPVSDWIQTRWPIVVAPVAGVAGAALTTYGILQLT